MIADLVLPVPFKGTEFVMRRATVEDLAALVHLMSDDPVSASRGDRAEPDDVTSYRQALAEVTADPSNELLVVDDVRGEVVGTMQLTRIPGLARRGATRLQVEAVRVHSGRRSQGIGAAMMRWVAETAAPAVGASLVQLTSDEARTDAHRFYERLGYVGSHRGFKLQVGE